MERIFEIKFLVPPMLIGFFALLLNPLEIMNIFTNMNLAEIVGSGSIVLLSLGVIISTMSESWVQIFALRNWRFNAVAENKIKELIPYKGQIRGSDYIELVNWIILDRWGIKHKKLYTQIHKRWYWTVANLNFSFATLAASALLVLPQFDLKCWVAIIWIVFLATFILLYRSNYKSVANMHETLVINYDKI